MRWSAVLCVAVLLAGCSADGPGVVAREADDSATESSTSSTTTLSPGTSTTLEPTTTSTVVPSSTTITPSSDDPDGVGDTLFPGTGNPGIDVEEYDVHLEVDDSSRIEGRVRLTISATTDRDAITLDAVALSIESVEIDGDAVDFEVEPTELRIHPDSPVRAGDTFEVTVGYSAEPEGGTGPAGPPGGWLESDDGSYVLNEPEQMRTWLPCNDHPSDKATWRWSIDVPDDRVAVANGDLVESGADGGAWVWSDEAAMPTYLVQLVIGDYEIIERPIADGAPVAQIDVVPAGEAELMADYFDVTDRQIQFYENLFGPYPFDSYGIAVIDSVPGLAMETQGRSMFSRSDLGGPVDELAQMLLSHELAHQWFGDAVSPARWSDIWLNESFATYAQWLWFDEMGIRPIVRTAADALDMRNSIAVVAPTAPGVQQLFGFEVYEGGALALHALRRTLGDDAFFALLREWVQSNVGASRTTQDFITLAEDMTGQDLQAFVDDWLSQPSAPDRFPN